MKDYFKEAIIPKDTDGIRPDIAELINIDMNNYREHMIKQYNGDDNCKGSFNRHISYCWSMVNGNEEFCR